MRFNIIALTSLILPAFIAAQLTGRVGPHTNIHQKRLKKVCNVLQYGAVASRTADLGPALSRAWNDCRTGGVVYIPPGDYGMSTWVSLMHGESTAIQLDGTIYRNGGGGGHMIIVATTNDFEFYSSTTKGAMQGFGYQYHSQNRYGPRLIRLQGVTNFKIHGLALVDSGAFHLIIDSCMNGEIYNIVVRGGNRGGLDGVDISGSNLWVHDVEVTNRDECVTIKNPSTNILVENVYCNWSGGCGIGSVGSGTSITNIHYRNVYTQNSNNAFMIKSNGGDGILKDIVLENFIGHYNAYTLLVDQYWAEMRPAAGPGVQLTNLTVRGWKGGEFNGAQRGPIKLQCADGAPCHHLEIDEFEFHTEKGNVQTYACRSAYGFGGCLKPTNNGQYTKNPYNTITQTISGSNPVAQSAPKMSGDLFEGLGLTRPINIPAIPNSFYPGVPAISPIPR